VKITVSVCRKEGRPSYGSEGATCQGEVDAPDDNPSPVITWAYALCDQAVAEQLARHRPEPEPLPNPPPPREPAQPAGGSWDQRHPNQRREPDSRPHDGWPRSGRELYPFARKREESGQCPGLIKRLTNYGRAVGHPDRIADWSGPQVDQALRSVLPAYDEPAPAETNGYHR
jgi:hypothetical protein